MSAVPHTQPKKPAAPRRRVASVRPADEPAGRVLRRFRVVFNAVKTHFREVEKQAGLAGAQLWALSVIRERPGLGVTELARAMDVHQSTASNLVKVLLEQELVGAKKNGTDRRTVQLRVLPAGTRALRRTAGPFVGILPTALASLDASTLARLDKDLAKVVAALGADKRGARVLIAHP